MLDTIETFHIHIWIPVMTLNSKLKSLDWHKKFPGITWVTCSVTVVGDCSATRNITGTIIPSIVTFRVTDVDVSMTTSELLLIVEKIHLLVLSKPASL